MTEYVPFRLDLSKQQSESIMGGMKMKQPVTIRMTHEGVHDKGNTALPLTKAQANKLLKHKNKGMGTDVRLSKTQLRKVRSGGYLGLLASNCTDYGDSFRAMKGEHTEAGIKGDPAEIEGEGIVSDLVDTGKTLVKKAAKTAARTAIRGACDVAANAAMTSIGVENPAAAAAADAVCSKISTAIVGEGKAAPGPNAFGVGPKPVPKGKPKTAPKKPAPKSKKQ